MLACRKHAAAGRIAFCDRLIEHLHAIPGVLAAATGTPLPLQGHEMTAAFYVEGHQVSPPDRPRSDFAIVTPSYFGAIGIPLLKGRGFSERDTGAAPPVLIVNETFARRHFPAGDAIGKRIQSGAGPKGVLREIVGIVGDAKQAALDIDSAPIHYFPFKQLPWGLGTVVLPTAVPPREVESAVRATVADLDGQAAVHQFRTGDDLAARAVAVIQLPMLLMGSFAAIALLLTVTGLYGVLSYAVARRRREIGVRIALGAGRGEVVRRVLRDAGVLVVAGLILGSATAAGAGRLLGSMVHGAQPGDAMVLACACCIMIITSLAAAYVPAVRAAAVEPMQALRSE